MLNCSENAFCSTLPAATRGKLCAQCQRRLSKAGSFQLYENFGRDISVILDGVICGSSAVSEDDVGTQFILPLFALCLPGRPLSLDVTFFGERQVFDLPYVYNDMVCLTDCSIATFDHKLFRQLFETDQAFAQALMRAAMQLMGDISQFGALMRADSVYTKVNLLMQKLLEPGIYLSRTNVANILACNRTSVSRAFARVEQERPALFAAYAANKHRLVEYYHS